MKGEKSLIRFTAPEEKAIKAVLTGKNQKTGIKLSYVFAFLLTTSLVFGIILSVVKGFYTPAELFSDYLFTGLVAFTVFVLAWSLIFVYKPIKQKELDDNGRYDVEFTDDGVKVLFPDEPEVFVSVEDIDEVVEYDIFYLIHCYGHKDEIVCSKSSLSVGSQEDFFAWCDKIGKPVHLEEKKIYRSIFKKVDKSVRSGVASVVFTAVALLSAYPLFWLAFEVFVQFVPNLLVTLLATLWDLKLIFIILLGILFLPIGITATIVSGLTALTVVGFPVFLLIVSFKCALNQLKKNKKAIGYIALIFSMLVIIATILIALWVVKII